MVLTREVSTLNGCLRLLHTAARELDQADVSACNKYYNQIRLMAVLADSLSRRVYADMEERAQRRRKAGSTGKSAGNKNDN